MAAQLEELGVEALEERLQLAIETPVQPPHRLVRAIAVRWRPCSRCSVPSL